MHALALAPSLSVSLFSSGSEARVVYLGVDQEKADQGVEPCVSGMASVSLVPRGDADIKAALTTLQLNFDLRDTITKEC